MAFLDRELERAALAYLDRFDSTAANLRRVLRAVVRRAQQKTEIDVEKAHALIEELLTRYCASGLIDDRRYAETMTESLRRRGASARAIGHKLGSRGVAEEDIVHAIHEADRHSEDRELEAARALVRRRRLGPFRSSEERQARRQRDLGALARAGFSFEVARRALEIDGDETD